MLLPGGELQVRPFLDNPEEQDSSWRDPAWGDYKQRGCVLGMLIMVSGDCDCGTAEGFISGWCQQCAEGFCCLDTVALNAQHLKRAVAGVGGCALADSCCVCIPHVSTSRSCPADLMWVCLLMSLQAYDCVSHDVPQLVCHLVTHMLAGCPPAVLQRMVAAGCKIAIIGRHQVWVLCAEARFEVTLARSSRNRSQLAADTTVASRE